MVLANTFNNYFIDSVSEITKLFTPSTRQPRLINDDQPIFKLENKTETEVKKIITTFKCSKAKDDYDIDTNFIKTYADALIQPITLMINQSLQEKVFPSSWKVATVTPIFKSGIKTLVANY